MNLRKLRPKSVCLVELVFSRSRRIGLFHFSDSFLVYEAPGSKPHVFKDRPAANAKFTALVNAALRNL